MDTAPSDNEGLAEYDIDWQTQSAVRVTLLEALIAEPRNFGELQSRTAVSQRTCEAILDDAETNDWISYDGVQYHITAIGKLIAVHLAALLEFFETISKDRTQIEAHVDQLRSIEVAISNLEQSVDNQSDKLIYVENQLNEKADSKDVNRLQETINEYSEQENTAQDSMDELSQRVEMIADRLDEVDEHVQRTQQATSNAESRNEELRTELEEVREIAERTADRTDRGWIDRLSGG